MGLSLFEAAELNSPSVVPCARWAPAASAILLTSNQPPLNYTVIATMPDAATVLKLIEAGADHTRSLKPTLGAPNSSTPAQRASTVYPRAQLAWDDVVAFDLPNLARQCTGILTS